MNIGLLCNKRDEKFYFNKAYYSFAKFLGTVNLIDPREDEPENNIDLLILPGGEDVLSVRYNEPPSQMCGMPHMDFEYFDLAVLPKYIEQKVPIVGICRGLQTLNVIFGGSLHQHVYELTSSYRWEHVHDAIDVKTKERFGINSLHHQAINKLGNGFEVTLLGQSKPDKKGKQEELQIEAIRHTELPIVAFQFHPEELFDDIKSTEATTWVYNQIESILPIE